MANNYNPSFYLVPIDAIGTNVNIREHADINSKIIATINKGQANPYLATGYFINETKSNLFWYQLHNKNNNSIAYCRNDVATTVGTSQKVNTTTTVSTDETQKLISDLVNNDKEIYKRLLIIGVSLDNLKAKGIDVNKQSVVYSALKNRYEKRQEAVKTSSLIKVKNYVDETEDWVKNKWNNFINVFNGLGEPISMTTIAISAVIVGAGATIALYYLFKPKYDESKADLKITGEFKKFLEQLPPATQEAIKKDLNTQIDDSYNQGKKDQWLTSNWSWIKNAGLLVGGVIVAAVFLPKLIPAKNG